MSNQFIYKVLDNGLQVYFFPDKTKHSTFIDFVVLYDGFYSDFKIENQVYHLADGMAHFIEHLCCERNSVGAFSKVFGQKQMSCNACTWPFATEFYVDTVEDGSFALEKLILGLSNQKFSEEDIEVTKPPIYQEIRMRHDEIGRKVLYTKTKNLFHNISYQSGLGNIEDVSYITLSTVQKCYDAFYQPKNEVLVVSGNFSPDVLFSQIEKIYSQLPKVSTHFEILKIEEPCTVLKKFEVLFMPIAKDYVDISYKVDFSKYLQNYRLFSYYLSLFLRLNFSEISPLYKKLVEEKVIDASISSSFNLYNNYLIISISGYVNQEEAFLENVKRVCLGNRNDKEEDFLLYLKQNILRKICNDNLPRTVVNQFVDNLVNSHYAGLDEIEELQNLNFQEYLNFINDLDFTNYTVTKGYYSQPK